MAYFFSYLRFNSLKIMVADSEIERIDKEFVVQIMRERERENEIIVNYNKG